MAGRAGNLLRRAVEPLSWANVRPPSRRRLFRKMRTARARRRPSRYAFRALAVVSFAIASFAVPVRAQDTLTVEMRLARIEGQLAEIRAALGIDTATAPPPVVLPPELAGSEHLMFGFPASTEPSDTALDRGVFVIMHDGGKRVPDWVAYHLTRDNLEGDAPRRDNFHPDTALPPERRSELADYRHSGFDRGHMAPAAAFKRSEAAMSATFVLSNMAPQRPHLNRGIWARLEDQVRTLVESRGSAWVFTGSLYLDAQGSSRAPPLDSIGPNRVAVPTHFFKAILAEDSATGVREMFAFIIPNSTNRFAGDPRDFAESVDRVEELSGFDFFAALPDDVEDRLERVVGNWPF